MPLDALHLAAGSVWLGGLIGLVVFWFAVARERRVAALGVVVPRFSNVALVSVLALIGSGIGQSLLELPTLGSLWETSYGKALLWKIGLLTVALVLASVNLARTKPRLEAGESSAPLDLRRFVSGEIVLVVGALFAAAVLTSLPPPSSALASVKNISARVGPGPVSEGGEEGPLPRPREGDAEPSRDPERLLGHRHEERKARSWGRSDQPVRHARHADGRAELPIRRAHTGHVLEVGARACDGGALGASVRGDTARPAAVRRHPPGQGRRMSVRARLLLALVALAAAAVAWVVVIDAIRRTILAPSYSLSSSRCSRPGPRAPALRTGRVAVDYRASVFPLHPPLVGAVDVRVLRPDLALRVRALAGHRVVVLGYFDEPFLRIGPGGVFVNEASLTAAGAGLAAAGTPPGHTARWRLHSHTPSATWHDARLRLTHVIGAPQAREVGRYRSSSTAAGRRSEE